jgi:pimeloyl-ACP methyl ester carboxylesterase
VFGCAAGHGANGNLRARMPTVTEHTGSIAGQPAFWRTAPAPAGGPQAPVVYVHGVPTSSDDWLPFLERTGGIAPDLPGFGRSGKRGDGRYTLEGYPDWLDAFLEAQGVDRLRLVVHDWGAVALVLAQRRPERIERLVVLDAVPLLAGYRWHRLARALRVPGLGELAMGAIARPTVRAVLRTATPRPGSPPGWFVDQVMAHLDAGTQRAILRLFRSAPPAALAAAGARLADLRCPALVAWGERDPFVPAAFAERYADVLGGPAEVLRLDDAGHWPWIDRPDLVDAVAAFLAAPA